MSYGYSSNMARCANIDKGTMHGMKSHDCHVFMECLLSISFSLLPSHVLNPLLVLLPVGPALDQRKTRTSTTKQTRIYTRFYVVQQCAYIHEKW